MRVRDYVSADRTACLAMFDGNTPAYFDPSERADFETFLDAIAFTYLVIEDDVGLAACGGWARRRSDPGVVDLCWGMVRRDLHRTGVGRALLEARLAQIRAATGVRAVALQTTQNTEGFFLRYGFVTRQVTPDGFAPGFHRHDMQLDL